MKKEHNYIISDTKISVVNDIAGSHTYILKNIPFSFKGRSSCIRKIKLAEKKWVYVVWNSRYKCVTLLLRIYMYTLNPSNVLLSEVQKFLQTMNLSHRAKFFDVKRMFNWLH